MKSKSILFAGLFLLASVSIASAQIKLSFNPDKGAKYQYLHEMSQNITQSMMGQEIPMETSIVMNYDMIVTDKNQQETKAQFTYRDVSYIISSAMMKMGYDSKNPIPNPSDLDKMMNKMLGCFIDKTFELRIADDGSVISVTGTDAIIDEMSKAVSESGPVGAQIGASLKQQFSDDAVKNMFEQSLKIYPVPAKPVKPGDSWDTEQNISVANMNSSNKTKYTLKSVAKNVATIDVLSTVNLKPSAGMEGELTGTQAGTMSIDTKSGMPASSELTQKIKGSIKVSGMDVAMDMTSKTKLTITKK